MDSLLDAIRDRAGKEARTPKELYGEMKQMGAAMFFTNTMSKEQVIAFCADMLKLYTELSRRNNADEAQ